MVNREQIIEMAQQAGMREPQPLSQDSGRWYPRDFAERFYALAYAAGQRDMRERAAWECDDMIRNGSFLAEDIQNAIRALLVEGENQ